MLIPKFTNLLQVTSRNTCYEADSKQLFFSNDINNISSLQMKQVRGYTIISKIGKGGFAKVYKAIKGKEQEIYALKKIDKKEENLERYVQGELDIAQQKLKHRNIVKILEYFKDENIYIVMEYCGMGDLGAYLVQTKPYLGQRIVFMTHMALGVNYLHTQNIIHRDLKPENVLITQKSGELVCKITDFGVSRIKQDQHEMFHTYIGSYPYMAPEITGIKNYANEVDIFALGMLFYAVYKYTILKNSFGSKSLIPGLYAPGDRIAYLNEVLKREKPTLERFLEQYFKDSNVTVGKFIFSMIDIQPENRPQMDFILMQITEIKVQHELYPTTGRQDRSIEELHNQIKTLKNELLQKSPGEKMKIRAEIYQQQIQELERQSQNERKYMQDTLKQMGAVIAIQQEEIAKLQNSMKEMKNEYQKKESLRDPIDKDSALGDKQSLQEVCIYLIKCIFLVHFIF